MTKSDNSVALWKRCMGLFVGGDSGDLEKKGDVGEFITRKDTGLSCAILTCRLSADEALLGATVRMFFCKSTEED